MDDVERSLAARQKLERGELPRLNPDRIWIHTGTWERCALCGLAIDETETEYELQFEMRYGLARSELVSFWFHAACYATWLQEKARF